MSQHDFNIANQGFPATRADINNAFQAIASNSSGPTAPSTTYANMWWYDTTNNKMYLRNEADSAWIEVATIDQANNEWQITTGQISAADGDGIVFKTDDGITRVTLDDSGSFFVGKGADNLTDNGQVFTTGGSSFTRGGGTTCQFNRNTSDGEIVRFSKDGTTVGGIGTDSGSGFDAMYIANGDTGLVFQGYANDAIIPFNENTFGKSDAAIDLGYASGRFKDLYLSGGAYLGGTTSVNHLDDYEEGTWTPAFVNIGTGTLSVVRASYVKVGNLCHIQVHLDISSTGTASGDLRISGFPFVTRNLSNLYAVSSTVHGTSWTTQTNGLNVIIGPNTTTTNQVYKLMANTSATTATHADIGLGNFLFSMSYYTA